MDIDQTSRIFRQYGGVLRTSEILRSGIHPRTLYRMRDDNRLIELSRGVYRLADMPPLEHSDLVTVAKRVPSGVTCLISALSFHGITTQIPHEVYIAIEKGKEKPALDFPPVRAFHFSSETYSPGIEKHFSDGNPFNVYSKEKTVADCFKFRNRIGLDVAIEGLRMCLNSGGSRKHIIEFSRICRVENVIRPYLEAFQ